MSRAGRPKGAEAKLDRETIEIAALALLDQGQAAFSMRALGAALSVTPMALYHHVGGREALIGTLADRVLEDVTAGEGSASERVAGLLQAYCRAVGSRLTSNPCAQRRWAPRSRRACATS